MGTWTQVTIDFDTSHLIFPTIIGCLLAVLGAAILWTRRRQILTAGGYWSGILRDMDKIRFGGTLVLTLVYFLAMVPVGDIWPNTGLGFLVCSVPYVILTGVLFLHERTVATIWPVALAGVVAPLLVWWLFTEIFFLTLP
ncbi:tripartite tricarboxylate transporter TctB family protein [Marinibacterium sp. SX1]|uniref:tripartite tricarboxylate transporter TctB family protein n=1 Tax=Marinibacterium sp. SX1 TaxID=3388424 RepID=UPI003D1762C0